jgi:hypothetical protein
VVDEAELCLTIPAALLEFTSANALISVRGSGKPLPDAEVLALFPNKTWKQATTDALGQAVIGLHTIDLPMTVFAAAHGFAAHCEREWLPKEDGLTIEFRPLPDGGAVIFTEDGGQITGLKGWLNPKRDTLDRTYLYASNIAINQGQQQPVHFALGEDLRLTDVNGVEMTARIVEIVGRSALVEYRPFKP